MLKISFAGCLGLSRIFRNFWMQRTFQEWIATKWLEIDQDNLRMKFSALNADFISQSADPPIDSRRPFHASIKEGYPSKNGYFTRLAVDMKFPIHIDIHIHRFSVDIHGYIHIHRGLSCVYAAPNFRKIHQCNYSVYLPPPPRKTWQIPNFKLLKK